MFLCFGCHIMIHVLKNDTLASITVPSKEKIIEYTTAINSKIPNPQQCLGHNGRDETLLVIASQRKIQEMYYNGWKVDHYVTNVFVFVPDGMIPIEFFNVPSSVHDSQVAEWGGIYDTLESVYKNLMVGFSLLTQRLEKLTVSF